MVKEISREWKTGTEDDYWVRTCAWSAPGCHPTGCGLKLHVRDGKLVEVEGDEEHPISQGRLCVRCLALKEYEYHPDRLVYPMRRNKEDRGLDKWERITWDEAYDEIVEKTEAIRAEWGARSLAVFGGTGREATNYYPALTYAVFRSPNCCTDLSGQSCYGPRCSITNFILGTGYPEFDYAQFFPDRYDNPAYELSEVLVLWGKGPLQSNGDGLFGHAVIDMMKRGTKIICVDPRLTWLTSKSEYHLQLRPGSDAMLALAWLNVIINEDLYDHDFVEKWCYGFAELKERVQEYTPARAAEVCWLSEEDIVASARMFANAKTGSIAWGVAIEMMSNGPQVAQCILDLNAITGRLDAPGGVVIGPKATLTGKWRYENQQYVDPEDMEARIGTKEYPASAASMAICHADTVLNVLETGKPYPLKFAWIHSTNLYACGTSVPQRWFEAMKKLDFIVASDLFMTPTIMGLADVFVPVATFPEHDGIVQPHFGRCTHFLGAMNKAVEYGETKSDLEICFDLGKRITPEAWPWDSVTEFYSWMLEDLSGIRLRRAARQRRLPGSLRIPQVREGPVPVRWQAGLRNGHRSGGTQVPAVRGLGRRPAAVLHRAAVQPAQHARHVQGVPPGAEHGRPQVHLVSFRASPDRVAAQHRPVAHRGNTPRDRGEVRHRGRRMGGDREPVRALPRKGPRHSHGRPARRPCAARVVVPRAGRRGAELLRRVQSPDQQPYAARAYREARIGRALQMPAVQNPSRQRTRRLGGRTMANALLIDHEYCTGCRSCEIACRNAHEDTIGSQQWGIHVHEEGPWKLSDNKWEWEYLPFPTHLCDLCAERVKEGRKPACVHHCLALCMEYGTVEEMAKRAEELGRNAVLFVPRVQGA